MCTGFTCAQGGINCATMGSSFDCVATCINNTPCASLGINTFTTCQHMCNPDAGTGDAGLGPDASPCDQACAHVQACTGITCSTVGVDCATLGSSYDCVAECVDNTPCASLGAGTFTTCQGQCGDGGAGDGGAGDAGPG
jgi:hypothetical protein